MQMTRFLRDLLLFSILASFVTGCAYVSPEVIYRLQDDVRELRKEVAYLKAEREKEKRFFEEAVSQSSGVASASELEIRKQIASMKADIEALRGEISAFQGFIDETKYQFKQDQMAIGERLGEDEKKILELEAKLERLAELEQRLKSLEERLSRISAGPSPAPARELPEKPAVPKGESVFTTEKEVTPSYRGTFDTPEDLYHYALGLIKEGKFREARRALDEFASSYKDHRLMPNVYYWRGETFYAEKDFESAAITFQEVIDKYPNSVKAPDALFKQGLCFLNLKDPVSAKAAFKLVISRYPASDAAKKAELKLREMEGKGGR